MDLATFLVQCLNAVQYGLLLFLVAMLVLRGQPWVQPMVLFLAIVATVLGSLAVDVIVVTRARIPIAPSSPWSATARCR